MPLSLQDLKDQIDLIVTGLGAVAANQPSIVPPALTNGKVYEAWALCHVLTELKSKEGYAPVLHRSSKVTLKSAPGPINVNFPCFVLHHPHQPTLEVWTDVEFLALSHHARGSPPAARGDYHELDIVVVPAGVTGRPRHDQIVIGVECKNTGYTKDFLRSILGVRRELSLLTADQPTRFAHWPRCSVPATPTSSVVVFSTDSAVLDFADPGETFGIDLFHLPLP